MWNGIDGWGWHMGWGMWLAHSILWWALPIVGIALLVVLLARPASRDSPRDAGPAPPPTETALDILKKRYARGEIDKAEFEEKKRDLAE